MPLKNIRLFKIIILLLSFNVGLSQVMNVRKWRKTERDSLDHALLLVDEKLYAQALPFFENLLKQHPQEQFLKYSYAKSALFRADKSEEAYGLLSEIYSKNKKIPDILYELALAAHYSYKFDEASAYLTQYSNGKRLSPDNKRDADILRRYITYAKFHCANPTKTKITNLGENINTADDESVPSINADGSLLVFGYAGPKSTGGKQTTILQDDVVHGLYLEDIYMSRKKNGVFQQASPVDSLNTAGPDAAVSLSPDGSVLFVYQDLSDGHGDLYQCFLSGGDYLKPQPLKGQVNSYSWDGHCSLSPDGQTLYFSSDRPGGRGGRDLYRATLGADSAWTNIVNLGDSVNTAEDEDAPFIHADGVSLYYSSKGRNSMGGYDIFRATMSKADTSFKTVKHLGCPLNSPTDDIYFVLEANGVKGYYSSGRKEGYGMKDIYLVEPNFSGPAPAICLVKGKVTLDKVPVTSTIQVLVSSQNGKRFNTIYSNSSTGEYLVALPAGERYQLVFGSTEGTKSAEIDAMKSNGYREITENAEFTKKRDTVQVAVKTSTALPEVKQDADGFVPRTRLQAKALRYIQKYGEVTAPALVFKVQIVAVKNTTRKYFPNLRKYGRITRETSSEGITRYMMENTFRSLRRCFNLNKKVVQAGYEDAFVVAYYKGKRVQFEELVRTGVFK